MLIVRSKRFENEEEDREKNVSPSHYEYEKYSKLNYIKGENPTNNLLQRK
jgi:hypothetical protein